MNSKYYYAEKSTKEVLLSDQKKVYLYGGYGGYNNFGDIIQLKNSILYHRRNTKLKPIIILNLSSLENPTHVSELKRWFNCDNIVFIGDGCVDTSNTTLELIEKVSSCSVLHIYGGGFLNKFWGESVISKIEEFVRTFNVGTYVFSGQQIDEATVPKLDEMFKKIGYPATFGVRDKQSLDYMMASTIDKGKVKFSFDDVTEMFELWRNNTTPSIKIRFIKKIRPRQLMWHMNTSAYATKNKKTLLDKMRKVKRFFPHDRVLLAHIYNDTRYSLRDTLQSVVDMENNFPYYEYGVVNLAQMALDLQVEKNIYPPVSSVLLGVRLAIASSYHVTMFAHYFGIPAYLMSENDFYSQKQKSLGLETDFQTFLNNPDLNRRTYKDERHARSLWLEYLTTMMNSISSEMPQQPEVIELKQNTQNKMMKLVYKNASS